MKGQVQENPTPQKTSHFHSGMVALRSIDERAAGWCRAYSASAIYRCGGSVGVAPTSHLTLGGKAAQAPEAGRILAGEAGNVKPENSKKTARDKGSLKKPQGVITPFAVVLVPRASRDLILGHIRLSTAITATGNKIEHRLRLMIHQ